MIYKKTYKTPEGFSDIILNSDGKYLTGLWFDGSRDIKKHKIDCEEKDLPIFNKTIKWLDIYFSGNEPDFTPEYKIENLTPFRKEVIDIIHKAEGKAFLAHPFEYRFKDTIEFINNLRKEKELDGIECFHPSANQEQRNILTRYAKNNNLYISGGSDYHGSSKPDIKIGVGRGDLDISKEILNWLYE